MRTENAKLHAENEALRLRVQDLENRLNQNSRNSHLPPSRDSKKVKAAFIRKKGKRKNGGQKGHEGSTLNKVDFVDEVEQLIPHRCVCGQSLKGIPYEIVETRQVFDIPAIQLKVKEYQLAECQCPSCHIYNYGRFPQTVKAPTQYGEKMKALCVMLNVDYKVPLRKISNLLWDLMGKKVNESTIVQMTRQAFRWLESTEQEIKERLLTSDVLHADETGVAVGNGLRWLHVNSNRHFTYQYIHEKRGLEAMTDSKSILSKCQGRIIHDCWSSYFKLDKVKHGLCGCHLLRELQALKEQKSEWASKFKDFLLQVYINSYRKNRKEKPVILRKYNRLIGEGIKEEPPPIQSKKRGRVKKTKGLNLLTRLKEHQASILAFAFDKSVPFTNNQGERDLRHLKTKLKIAGCFRSLQGADCYARISSVTSTLRKNKLNVYQALVTLFQNHSYTLSAIK